MTFPSEVSEPWPYNLPIFRRSHRASSPDGTKTAWIDPAYEVGMSNPTRGTLVLSTGIRIDGCNPSFIWSDDSRYLAVPRFFLRLGLFRRQRLVVIDVKEPAVFASTETAHYFQPESFGGGRLVVTKEPLRGASQLAWQVPEDLRHFDRINEGPAG